MVSISLSLLSFHLSTILSKTSLEHPIHWDWEEQTSDYAFTYTVVILKHEIHGGSLKAHTKS